MTSEVEAQQSSPFPAYPRAANQPQIIYLHRGQVQVGVRDGVAQEFPWERMS